jgi:hypothetical protein
LQVQKTDSIHWRTGPSDPWAVGFVAAVGAQEVGSQIGHELLELAAGEAFVCHDGVAVQLDALQHLGGDNTLGQPSGGFRLHR